MTCIKVIEEAKCNSHDAIIIGQRTLKNSIVVASGGATKVNNLLYYNLFYNLILFSCGYHMHFISKFLVVDGAQ